MKPEWLKDDADFYRNGLNEHDEEVTQNTEKQIFLKIHFVFLLGSPHTYQVKITFESHYVWNDTIMVSTIT
jgi:hypothetical protein